MEKQDKYKIGDIVRWDFGGGKYEIIATKTQPIPTGPMGPQYPIPPANYILRKLNTTEDFTPFSHAAEQHLKLV